MANDATYGFESRFAFEAAGGTFDSSSLRFEVVSSTVGKQGEIIDAAGLLGSRTRRTDRTRAGLVRVGGQLVLEPSTAMFDFFSEFILGGAESTNTFDVANNLPGFDMVHDYLTSGTSAIKYGELYVNRCTIRGQAGQLMRMTLDLIGKTVTTGQTFVSAALGSTAVLDDPLIFHDSASGITIRSGSGTQELEEFELTIDNQLDVKFRNSQTASSIRAQDRIVSLASTMPMTATILSTYFGDKTAADATLVFTRSGCSVTISLFNLMNPDQSPQVNGKGEVALLLQSAARGDSSDPDVRFVVDEVP